MGWMYCPLDNTAVLAALGIIYRGDLDPASLRSRLVGISPHRLATIMMVFALAMLFSVRDGDTRRYFNAATALLTVPDKHFMVRHSIEAVECLHMMVSYLFGLGHGDAAKAAWPVLGLAVRTACALGMHREGSRWGLTLEQRENRSRIWYECATYDILQSLNFGRPYSTPTQLSDCPLPSLPSFGAAGVDQDDALFHNYKWRQVQLFFRVTDCLASAELPDYGVVMALDKQLRDVDQSAPIWLRWDDRPFNDPPSLDRLLSARQIAQQAAAAIFVHKALLGA